MANIEPFPIPQPQNGTIREAAIDEAAAPETTVELALNMNFDRVGVVSLRPGLTILGDQIEADTPVLGMGNYRNNAGTLYRALAKVGTAVFAWAGTVWSSVRSGLDAASKARFTNFIDLTYMVNGHDNEPVSTYDGTTFGSSQVASLPPGDFIENYRSRIWVADNSDDKVYYTNVVEPNGTITGGTAFIQVSPQDGEKITGLKRSTRCLLVFKQNHIYRIFSPTSADPDPSIFRGTYSQESIIEGKDGISYHHPTGFYNFIDGPVQEEISRPIIDFVQAIPRSEYENIVGWVDENTKQWATGSIVINGITFHNVVFRYSISTKVWTIYSYNKKITAASEYDDGENLFSLVGNEDGKVLQYDEGTSDDGEPIHFDLITHWMYFTTAKSTSKGLSQIAVLHQNASGAIKIQYQLDDDKEGKWRDAGTIKDEIYQNVSVNAPKFTRIRFRIFGSVDGAPFIYRGIDILNLITTGHI